MLSACSMHSSKEARVTRCFLCNSVTRGRGNGHWKLGMGAAAILSIFIVRLSSRLMWRQVLLRACGFVLRPTRSNDLQRGQTNTLTSHVFVLNISRGEFVWCVSFLGLSTPIVHFFVVIVGFCAVCWRWRTFQLSKVTVATVDTTAKYLVTNVDGIITRDGLCVHNETALYSTMKLYLCLYV